MKPKSKLWSYDPHVYRYTPEHYAHRPVSRPLLDVRATWFCYGVAFSVVVFFLGVLVLR